MVKVVCGKSRIGESSNRAKGMGQIVLGKIELGERHGPYVNSLIYFAIFYKQWYCLLSKTCCDSRVGRKGFYVPLHYGTC